MKPRDEYQKIVRRPYPPFFVSLMYGGYANPRQYAGIVDKKILIRELIHTDGIFYYNKREMDRDAEIVYNSWARPAQLRKAIKIFKRREKALINSAAGPFIKYCRAYEAYMPALYLVFLPEAALTEDLLGYLTEKLGAKKANQLFSAINLPRQDSFMKLCEIDLVTTKDLKAHARKFEWINSRYGDSKSYTAKEARKKLSKINKQNYLRQERRIKDELRRNINKAKQILGREKAHLVDLMQFIVYYRTQRTDIMNKSGYYFIPVLKEKAAEKGVTYKQLLHCTKDEILTKVPCKKVLNARIKENSMLLENGKIKCVAGAASRKVTRYFEDKVDNIRQLSGNTACAGRVKGRVKIVIKAGDYKKIRTGDILVTSMTTPDMMPIMGKAAAFVTEEGGITCHAAIVAREMKKPCVIGTKIATKVLKDGDKVKVDANKGIVKKI